MQRTIILEALLTFLLTFMTGMSQNSQFQGLFNDNHYSRAAILTIQYMIYFYIGQRISGGMVNPIISFGLAVAKKLQPIEVG